MDEEVFSGHGPEDMLMEEEEEVFERTRENLAQQAPEGGASILTWLSSYRELIFVLIIIALVLKWKLKDWQHRWFAAFMAYMNKEVDVEREKMKKELFSSLSSMVSHDPALKKTGALKILEIGVGTGTNFAYYPEGTHLIVVDPNPHFKKYYEVNRKKFPNIQAEDIIVSTGEEMDMIPDNSVDVVVVTLVFCSVNDTDKILKQILRILTPGGRFYLYEHIQEFDTENHYIRKMFQTILSQSGIWPFLLDNCYLDRNMQPNLERAGFSKLEIERIHMPIDHFIFQLIQPSLKGYAIK